MTNTKNKPLRLKQRLNAIATDETEHIERTITQSKADDELFVIDKIGDVTQKRKHVPTIAEREAKRQKKLETSHRDEAKVKKLLDANTPEKIMAMVAEGRQKMKQKSSKTKNKNKTTFDLWDDNATPNKPTKKKTIISTAVPSAPSGIAPLSLITPTTTIATPSKKKSKPKNRRPTVAIDCALPGQSYRPDQEQHQDAIGEALAIEIRRNEAADYRSQPLRQGLLPETAALIVNSDDESDSSSSDEEEDGMMSITTTTTPRRKTETLTRTQRNKQRRAKRERTLLLSRKREKRFTAALHNITAISKDLRKTERRQSEERRLKLQLMDEKLKKPLGVNLYQNYDDALNVPTFPVSLTEELEETEGGGGLRRVRPKGSLMTERVVSLKDRGLVNGKNREVGGMRRKKRVKPVRRVNG